WHLWARMPGTSTLARRPLLGDTAFARVPEGAEDGVGDREERRHQADDEDQLRVPERIREPDPREVDELVRPRDHVPAVQAQEAAEVNADARDHEHPAGEDPGPDGARGAAHDLLDEPERDEPEQQAGEGCGRDRE